MYSFAAVRCALTAATEAARAHAAARRTLAPCNYCDYTN